MADIVLHLRPELVKRLEDIAHRENRPVDDVVESLLTHYDPSETTGAEEAPSTLLLLAETAEAEGWDLGRPDLAERSREILENEFAADLLKRNSRAGDPSDE